MFNQIKVARPEEDSHWTSPPAPFLKARGARMGCRVFIF